MNTIDSKNDISIKHIESNWRYRILRYKDKIYLLDISTYWFSFLLITISWLLPMNIYEIDERIVQELGEKNMKELKSDSGNIFLIVSLSLILASLVDKIIDKIYLDKGLDIVYVYGIPVFALSYFTISRFVKKKKTLRLLGENRKEKQIEFKISPEIEKVKGRIFYFPVLILIIIILPTGLLFGRNIITKIPDAIDYLGYFLGYFCWYGIGMYSVLRTEHLVGATVIIEDKERK